MHKKFYYF